MGCPFCPIIERTEWYLEDLMRMVVACRDLNDRGYKYRILVVGSGPEWHRPWKDYIKEEREFLKGLAEFIANYHIKIGKAKTLVKADTTHFSVIEHGHCQVCMR